MTATLPAAWRGLHQGTGAEWGQLVNALNAIVNIEILNTTTAALSSTSTAYVDVTNTSFGYTKRRDSAGSDLGFLLMLSASRATAGTNTTYGINDGTADHDNHKFTYNTASRVMWSCGFSVVTGLAAGNFTIKVRAKGSAANTMTIAAGDTLSLMVLEIGK